MVSVVPWWMILCSYQFVIGTQSYFVPHSKKYIFMFFCITGHWHQHMLLKMTRVYYRCLFPVAFVDVHVYDQWTWLLLYVKLYTEPGQIGLPNDVTVCIFLYLINNGKHLMITMAEEQIHTRKHTNGADWHAKCRFLLSCALYLQQCINSPVRSISTKGRARGATG